MKLVQDHPRIALLFVLLVVVVTIRLTVPTHIITSGSMGETLPVYTIIVLGQDDQLEPGDVITFQEGGEAHVTTHTFIGYDEDGSLMTKGDANLTPDVHVPPLTMDDVKGKVVYALTPLRSAALALIIVAVFLFAFPWGRTEDGADEQSTTDDTLRAAHPA